MDHLDLADQRVANASVSTGRFVNDRSMSAGGSDDTKTPRERRLGAAFCPNPPKKRLQSRPRALRAQRASRLAAQMFLNVCENATMEHRSGAMKESKECPPCDSESLTGRHMYGV